MIDRVIHQIFLGKLPPREASWCDQMRRMNPSWKYVFWNEEQCARYDDDPIVMWLKQSHEPIAFVVDRLRVLILREFGGVYLDCDCQPVKPLDTITCWNEADFVCGMRSPDRPHISLTAPGIGLIDNTVLGSAKQGRMIRRLCDLYTASSRKQTGMSMGREVLRNADEGTRILNYRYFYALEKHPETVVLHDLGNMGSWVRPNPASASPAVMV